MNNKGHGEKERKRERGRERKRGVDVRLGKAKNR